MSLPKKPMRCSAFICRQTRYMSVLILRPWLSRIEQRISNSRRVFASICAVLSHVAIIGESAKREFLGVATACAPLLEKFA
jgi:hypothetical protein